MAVSRALRLSAGGWRPNALWRNRRLFGELSRDVDPSTDGWTRFTRGAVAVGTTVAACGAAATAYWTYKNYEDSKTIHALRLYERHPQVGKCLSQISTFYQDRQCRKDDAEKKPERERTRPNTEAIALDWAREKRSKGGPSPDVMAVDECRQVTSNFFKQAYMLLDKGIINEGVFLESFYARSGNFKRLVEPLDKANFDLVNQNPGQTYMDGGNRPAIYARIERAENEPRLKDYF